MEPATATALAGLSVSSDDGEALEEYTKVPLHRKRHLPSRSAPLLLMTLLGVGALAFLILRCHVGIPRFKGDPTSRILSGEEEGCSDENKAPPLPPRMPLGRAGEQGKVGPGTGPSGAEPSDDEDEVKYADLRFVGASGSNRTLKSSSSEYAEVFAGGQDSGKRRTAGGAPPVPAHKQAGGAGEQQKTPVPPPRTTSLGHASGPGGQTSSHSRKLRGPLQVTEGAATGGTRSAPSTPQTSPPSSRGPKGTGRPAGAQDDAPPVPPRVPLPEDSPLKRRGGFRGRGKFFPPRRQPEGNGDPYSWPRDGVPRERRPEGSYAVPYGAQGSVEGQKCEKCGAAPEAHGPRSSVQLVESTSSSSSDEDSDDDES